MNPILSRYLLCVLVIQSFSALGQIGGLQLLGGKEKITIPFELSAGYILLDVKIKNVISQKFIFDTGAEHTLYLYKDVADILGFTVDKYVTLLGADLGESVLAQISRNILVQLDNSEKVTTDFVVLDTDNLDLFEHTGVRIGGIFGGRFFRHLVVEIDYRKRKLTLWHPDHFNRNTDRFTEHEIEVNKSKPYIICDVDIRNSEPTAMKMLVDSGAALTIMLQTDQRKEITIPDNAIPGRLGKGLGGYIEGYLGKINSIYFGDYEFNDLITNYQLIDENIDPDAYNYRNGILGNLLLKKFHVIIDYIREKIYLRPTRDFSKEIKFNKSGMIIFSFGDNLNEYFVFEVLKGSPAEKAGIQTGDVLKKIGILNTRILRLRRIDRKFSKKVGKSYKLTIVREGIEIKKEIILEDYFSK